jgi:hypothetical protein
MNVLKCARELVRFWMPTFARSRIAEGAERGMTKAGLWLNASIAALGIVGFTFAATVMGYKWLSTDEADRAYACGSGSRGGLCTSGETTNMVRTFVFGVLAID